MKFERRGLGYVATFPQGGAEVTLDKIKARGDELRGELSVESAHASEGYGGSIFRGSFNVSSMTVRRSTAKTLAGRAEGIDWEVALERFCTSVLAAEREGAPIELVGRDVREEKDAYLVEPFLLRNRTGIIYGEGQSGKSYLGAAIAVSVALGKSPLPVCRFPSNFYPGPVLVLDWESDKGEWNERLQDCALGIGETPPDNIYYRACAGPFVDMAEQVARFVEEKKVALVIVDSAGLAAPPASQGDPAEAVIRMFAAFRYLSTAILLIDHVTGGDLDSKKKVSKPYGSVYKMNLARTVWELKRGENDGETRHVVMHHRKVNREALRPPIGMSIRHDVGAITFSSEDFLDDPALAESAPAWLRIWGLLREEGPLSTGDIAEAIDISDSAVRTNISRHPKDFEKDADHRWNAVRQEDAA